MVSNGLYKSKYHQMIISILHRYAKIIRQPIAVLLDPVDNPRDTRSSTRAQDIRVRPVACSYAHFKSAHIFRMKETRESLVRRKLYSNTTEMTFFLGKVQITLAATANAAIAGARATTSSAVTQAENGSGGLSYLDHRSRLTSRMKTSTAET